MINPASGWSDEQVEEFFNKLLVRGNGFLSVERKDNLFILKSAGSTHHVFTSEQFIAAASDVEHCTEH